MKNEELVWIWLLSAFIQAASMFQEETDCTTSGTLYSYPNQNKIPEAGVITTSVSDEKTYTELCLLLSAAMSRKAPASGYTPTKAHKVNLVRLSRYSIPFF